MRPVILRTVCLMRCATAQNMNESNHSNATPSKPTTPSSPPAPYPASTDYCAALIHMLAMPTAPVPTQPQPRSNADATHTNCSLQPCPPPRDPCRRSSSSNDAQPPIRSHHVRAAGAVLLLHLCRTSPSSAAVDYVVHVGAARQTPTLSHHGRAERHVRVPLRRPRPQGDASARRCLRAHASRLSRRVAMSASRVASRRVASRRLASPRLASRRLASPRASLRLRARRCSLLVCPTCSSRRRSRSRGRRCARAAPWS